MTRKMGELPEASPGRGGYPQDMLLGEVGDNLEFINTDISSMFKETSTRRAAVVKKSTSVTYLPEGLLDVDLLNPRSLLHKKSMAGYQEIRRNSGSAEDGAGHGIPGVTESAADLRIPGAGGSDGSFRIAGSLANRRGSFAMQERIGSGSGRSNTMPCPTTAGNIQTSEKGESIKKDLQDEMDSQSIPLKVPVYQTSQSLIETTQSSANKEIKDDQKVELDERRLSAPNISTQTPPKSRKISEVLMSSWFFQSKSSATDVEENNQKQNETDKEASTKNNVNFSHSDIGDKKMSLSNFVAGNFTAVSDLRSLNAFVPQST